MRICPFCNKSTTKRICPYCGVPTIAVREVPEQGNKQEYPIIIGRYEMHEQIGEGGSGKIYLGYRIEDRQKVAIKVIYKSFVATPEDAERMRRGVLACSLLNHPNIVQIYDFGKTDRGEPVIVMEFINGDTLTNILKKHGPMDPATAIVLLKQMAGALDYAHRKGIVHRDIKPDNIMLEKQANGEYRATLADFGVARWFKGGKRLVHPTIKGVAVGTPGYMSPEQINGLPDIDGRVDIYGLGVVAYEVLTGTNPFKHTKLLDTLRAHLYGSLPDFPEDVKKQAPVTLLKVIQRMLKKDRNKRIQSAGALLRALSAIN